MLLPVLSLLFAQAAAPPTLDEDRLTVCLDQARSDPASAIAAADAWLAETAGPQRSLPRQCLGTAYVSLLRWDAAQAAFLAGRDERPATDHAGRARLGAMAGNAALAAGEHEGALAVFDRALADAREADISAALAGTIAADRARALVALGREDEAGAMLADARRDAPQQADVWLLSATLARRLDDLAQAQAHIETAAALAPDDAAIGLEAGLIAALTGRDDAARASWRSVIATHPASPESTAAAEYLAQLDGAPPAR